MLGLDLSSPYFQFSTLSSPFSILNSPFSPYLCLMPEIQLTDECCLTLLPQKAAFWKERSTLIVSDLHLGKAGHFRKHGIAVPGQANAENLWHLSGLLMEHKPDRLLLLGDLFHSDYNHEWESFTDMLGNFPDLSTELVLGNHDVLPRSAFESEGIVCHDALSEGGIYFTHEPCEPVEYAKGYNLCGHIHPAIILRGKGRQSLRLPVFWFGSKGGVLPAFGYFTGMHVVRPAKTDKVFAVTSEDVMVVS